MRKIIVKDETEIYRFFIFAFNLISNLPDKNKAFSFLT